MLGILLLAVFRARPLVWSFKGNKEKWNKTGIIFSEHGAV